jgi:hypothetical protein
MKSINFNNYLNLDFIICLVIKSVFKSKLISTILPFNSSSSRISY